MMMYFVEMELTLQNWTTRVCECVCMCACTCEDANEQVGVVVFWLYYQLS